MPARVSSRNFILGGSSRITGHGEGRVDFIIVIIGNILGGGGGGGGGEVKSVWGEVELFGGEASPAPPSLNETLPALLWE